MGFLVVWLFLAFIGALLGGLLKGRAGEGFLLGLLLGVIGWLIIFLLHDHRLRCPECRGVIEAGAGRCKNCGAPLMASSAR